MHACVHTYIHTYTHTYTNMHTHIHTIPVLLIQHPKQLRWRGHSHSCFSPLLIWHYRCVFVCPLSATVKHLPKFHMLCYVMLVYRTSQFHTIRTDKMTIVRKVAPFREAFSVGSKLCVLWFMLPGMVFDHPGPYTTGYGK